MKIIKRFLSKMSNEVLIGIGIGVIGLLSMYILDVNNIPTKLGISAISAWATFLGSIFAVLGTYLITRNSMQKQINNEKELWNEEKALHKENMYRSMNKQNAGHFYTEIEKFIDRLAYVGILKSIETVLVEDDLFQSDYEEANKYNNRFLINVLRDYYYDDEIVELCEEGIDNQIVDKSEDKVWELCNKFRKLFLGYDRGDKKNEFDDISKAAFMKLYQKLYPGIFSNKEAIRFKMDAYLLSKDMIMYYFPSGYIKEYFEFINNVRKIIENDPGYCYYDIYSVLTLIHSSSDKEHMIRELKNRENLNGKSKEKLISLFTDNEDYFKRKGIIEECFSNCDIHLLEYGKNTDEEKEKYLKLIEKKFFSIEPSNYFKNNIEPNHYF